jgi:N utilization substance protein A
MKSEFTLAFNEIAEHSKLKREIILEALENAMVTAYRKAVNASAAQHVVVKIDPATGTIRVFAEKEVVDAVQEVNTEVALGDAHKVDPQAKLGDMVTVESTPKNFGRIAAQAAKQIIQQRLREAERESQYAEYSQREGDIVNGTVQAISQNAITLGLGRAEATLPRAQTLPGERYHAHEKVRAYVLEVRKSPRGPQIIVSRAHKGMLRRLLEFEVPEIYNGQVEIKSIAREPGQRSKVAVAALQDGVDPVGACVGMRGVRIQSIVKELNDEKIDVIEWNPDQAAFIAKALSPARVTAVYLNDDPLSGRTAMVVVPDDQLSLAIGREGQNARLAAKLTNWRIDIKSLTEAAVEAFRKLAEETAFAEVAAHFSSIFSAAREVLARKLEGKPLPPEEYQLLAKSVDLVEKKVAKGRQEERAAKVEKAAALKATVPAGAHKLPLNAAGLSDRLYRLLADADFVNVGQVMEQLALDEDRLLGIEGFGPKMLDELRSVLGQLAFPEAVVAEPPKPAAEAVGAPSDETPVQATLPLSPSDAPAETGPKMTLEELFEEEGGESLEPTKEGADEESDDPAVPGKKKATKKVKKKGTIEVTYDEDLGMYITRKKRKASRSSKDGVFDMLDEE